MYIDEAKIIIKSGDGGQGSVSFRHEKYIPRGGPDGGDGGRGGDVIFLADPSIHGLEVFRHKVEFIAQNGENGMKSKKFGAKGEDLMLRVPPGTIIMDLDKNILYDFKEKNELYIALKGGRGGIGNAKLSKADLQTPNFSIPPTLGKSKEVNLEIRYIAEVGIVGKPNAGKSTLLSVISNARPKIADYAFTSLAVTLGRVDYKDKYFVAADIPGLIEDSSHGRGLGIKFLKHTLRTKVLLHLIDSTNKNPKDDYIAIRKELTEYDLGLVKKPEIVVFTKCELINTKQQSKIKKEIKSIKTGSKIIFISSADHAGLKQLLSTIWEHLDKLES